MSKELEEEVSLPDREFHFPRWRSLIWVGFQDVERHSSYEREILWRMVLSRPGVVFIEDDVERPMYVVLYAPMLSDDFHQLARRLSFR